MLSNACFRPKADLSNMHRPRQAVRSGRDVRLVDLADHGPLSINLQQMEEIGKAETGNVVGGDASARGATDNVNSDDRSLRFGRRTEGVVDAVEQILDRATSSLRELYWERVQQCRRQELTRRAEHCEVTVSAPTDGRDNPVGPPDEGSNTDATASR